MVSLVSQLLVFLKKKILKLQKSTNHAIWIYLKKKLLIFNTKINLDNSKIFYSRFLIPKKNRIDLVPINLLGKINLESYEINLDKIYFENELDQKELDEDELLLLQENINEIFSQNSLNNILKYSNLRKIIQSFFN